MRDVLIDQNGDLRCPNCHGKNFDTGHTMRGKLAVGVGVLLTAKKLRCLACGKYAKGGNAEKWEEPRRPATPPATRIAVTAQPSGTTSQVTVTGTNDKVAAVVSAKLLPVIGISRAAREGYAAAILTGETVPVATMDTSDAEALATRLRNTGFTVEVSYLPPTV